MNRMKNRRIARFGIVTPALDARRTFAACAASVARCRTVARDAETIHFVRESDRSAETVEDIALAHGCDYLRGPDSGLYDAIARGLDDACAAGCDAVGWLNADEQYLPCALAAAQRVFESNGSIGLVFGDYLLLDSAGAVRAARREIPARRFYLRNGVNYLLSCTVFFRREVWENSKRFDLSYRFLADKKFYLSLLDSGVKCSLIPEYLAAFSMTGNNASLLPDAVAEQARLRDEIGAFRSPAARGAVRALRALDKALHGCYFPDGLDCELFAPDGSPVRASGRFSPFWRWQPRLSRLPGKPEQPE